MKVELQHGDTITIPEGCKATVKDNQIIVEEQQEFKDGDIVISKFHKRVLVFLNYREGNKQAFDNYSDGINVSKSGWSTTNFRLATEEEKQAFFNVLEINGLRWNVELKQMEKIRKRAKKGDPYLCIGFNGDIWKWTECDDSCDYINFTNGNYYLPDQREQAEEDAQAIKEIFKRRKEGKI